MPVMGDEACASAPVRLRLALAHPRVHEANPDPVALDEARQAFGWVAHVAWCGMRFHENEVDGQAHRTTCATCMIAKGAAAARTERMVG